MSSQTGHNSNSGLGNFSRIGSTSTTSTPTQISSSLDSASPLQTTLSLNNKDTDDISNTLSLSDSSLSSRLLHNQVCRNTVDTNGTREYCSPGQSEASSKQAQVTNHTLTMPHAPHSASPEKPRSVNGEREGSCSPGCEYLPPQQSVLTWMPACVVGRIPAYTIIHVINNRTNSTRTITKSAEVSFINEDVYTFAHNGNSTPFTKLELSRGPNSTFTTTV
jgi:hypothetical protein